MGNPHIDPNFICANMNRKTTSSYIFFFVGLPKRAHLIFASLHTGRGTKLVKGLYIMGTPTQEAA